MSQDATEIDLDAIQRRMDGAMTSLKTEFASLRTGRASAAIVEPIQVDAYGQMTPINQLGTVNVPEPRMVVINVWDKGMISKVETRDPRQRHRHQPDRRRPADPPADPRTERGTAARADEGRRAICRTGQGRDPQRAPRRDGPDQEGQGGRHVGR